MLTHNTIVVLLGTCLFGACSGLVGGFAVLRRRALIGDALSHAALPGLSATAYIKSGFFDFTRVSIGL